jgi:hypothetical protein
VSARRWALGSSGKWLPPGGSWPLGIQAPIQVSFPCPVLHSPLDPKPLGSSACLGAEVKRILVSQYCHAVWARIKSGKWLVALILFVV